MSRQFIGSLLIGLAILLGGAAWILIATSETVGDVEAIEQSLLSNPGSPPTMEAVPTTTTTKTDETRGADPLWSPNEVSRLDRLTNLSGPPPVGIAINQIGVDAPIHPYGINSRTGEMDVPRNVRDVAWYRHGSLPGDAGSAVLAAHVDLESQGPGVFFDLNKLRPGDQITVTFADGSAQGFEVVARTIYMKEALPLDVIFSRRGRPVLTLVTCGGGFDTSDARYDSNVVVYAVPLNPNWDSDPN